MQALRQLRAIKGLRHLPNKIGLHHRKLSVRSQWFDTFNESNMQTYKLRAPSYERVTNILENDRGSRIDHVAMRSFSPHGLSHCARPYLESGYAVGGDIIIPGLPLVARWYKPPTEHTGVWPKVFISELDPKWLPRFARDIVNECLADCFPVNSPPVGDTVPSLDPVDAHRLYDTPRWNVTLNQYNQLVQHTCGVNERSILEYAAWTLVHAQRINHAAILLTVPISVGNEQLITKGPLELTSGGGADGYTQGGEADGLEQSSTLADTMPHRFACGAVQHVPGAFVELVSRHRGFEGFLGDNAKGVFKSTHTSTNT